MAVKVAVPPEATWTAVGVPMPALGGVRVTVALFGPGNAVPPSVILTVDPSSVTFTGVDGEAEVSVVSVGVQLLGVEVVVVYDEPEAPQNVTVGVAGADGLTVNDALE